MDSDPLSSPARRPRPRVTKSLPQPGPFLCPINSAVAIGRNGFIAIGQAAIQPLHLNHYNSSTNKQNKAEVFHSTSEASLIGITFQQIFYDSIPRRIEQAWIGDAPSFVWYPDVCQVFNKDLFNLHHSEDFLQPLLHSAIGSFSEEILHAQCVARVFYGWFSGRCRHTKRWTAIPFSRLLAMELLHCLPDQFLIFVLVIYPLKLSTESWHSATTSSSWCFSSFTRIWSPVS